MKKKYPDLEFEMSFCLTLKERRLSIECDYWQKLNRSSTFATPNELKLS